MAEDEDEIPEKDRKGPFNRKEEGWTTIGIPVD